MYCHSCGTKAAEGAAYCGSCGKKHDIHNENEETTMEQVKAEEPAEVEQNNLEENMVNESRSGTLQSKKKAFLPGALAWGIPLVSLLAAGGGSYVYYDYEKSTNETVLQLKEEAETKAVDGKYEDASKLLNKAITLRPNYEVLKDDLAVIEVAASYEDSLKKTDELIKQQKYDEVSSEINKLKEKVQSQEGPLFEPFMAKISDKETTLTIARVKTEIKNLNEVDGLASKLSMVSDLKAKEAAGIAAEIKEKIVKVSMDEAEEHVESNDFSNALAVVDEALEYAKDDKKLLSFKESVESQQAAFERAEQQRIEEAMEAAAAEDLKNRQAAVELVYLDAVVDEYGDLNISGEIKNTASRSISFVTLFFTIYDDEGNYIDEGTTNVYPYDLAPGEAGAFDEVYYGINENVNVTVDNATWYLE